LELKKVGVETSLVLSWELFGNCLGIVWYFLSLIIKQLSIVCGNCLGIVWELFGNCLGIVWEFEGRKNYKPFSRQQGNGKESLIIV
jgi:hypothetical protein